MQEQKIVLYPSNWLYNAGVIGFLRVLEECGEDVENFLQDDGSVKINSCIFPKIDVNKFYIDKNTRKISIIGKNQFYKNYIQKGWELAFEKFVKESLPKAQKAQNLNKCDICGEGYVINLQNIQDQNSEVIENIKKFINGIRKFDARLNSILGPSKGEFPNSFWSCTASLRVCDLCGYILIHHHLSLTKLQDGSEIFINAPSFKLMWHLNNYVRTLYGGKEIKGAKEVLGISLIELVTKLNIHLGRWEKMNIEVVSKYRVKKGKNKYEDTVDFFSLSSDIVDLLSDREIASLLKQIGEFKILNMVLDGEFNGILEFGEKALRDAMKRKSGKDTGTDFINEDIKLKKNKEDLFSFSQKLFKLYALIKSELKKEVIA